MISDHIPVCLGRAGLCLHVSFSTAAIRMKNLFGMIKIIAEITIIKEYQILLLRVPCQKTLAAVSSLLIAFLNKFYVLSQFVYFTSWSVNNVLLLPHALFPTILPVTARYSRLSFLNVCLKKQCVFLKCLTWCYCFELSYSGLLHW